MKVAISCTKVINFDKNLPINSKVHIIIMQGKPINIQTLKQAYTIYRTPATNTLQVLFALPKTDILNNKENSTSLRIIYSFLIGEQMNPAVQMHFQ